MRVCTAMASPFFVQADSGAQLELELESPMSAWVSRTPVLFGPVPGLGWPHRVRGPPILTSLFQSRTPAGDSLPRPVKQLPPEVLREHLAPVRRSLGDVFTQVPVVPTQIQAASTLPMGPLQVRKTNGNTHKFEFKQCHHCHCDRKTAQRQCGLCGTSMCCEHSVQWRSLSQARLEFSAPPNSNDSRLYRATCAWLVARPKPVMARAHHPHPCACRLSKSTGLPPLGPMCPHLRCMRHPYCMASFSNS